MKRNRFGWTTLLAVVMGAFAVALSGAASAELLVHEPFDYDPDEVLTGNGGALGTTGTWYSFDTISGDGKTQDWFVHEEGEISGVGLSGANPSIEPLGEHLYDGTVGNLATSGGYVGLWGADDWNDPDGPNIGEPGRNLDANIGLAPGVTATFEEGSTTWISYVAVRGWDRNEETPNLTIGTDPTPDGSRAASLANGGSGLGTGGGPPRINRGHIYPMFFDGGVPRNHIGVTNGWRDDSFTVLEDGRMDWQELDADGYFGAVNIVVIKIEWDADFEGEDIISVARFLEGEVMTEDAFEDLIDARPNLSSANWDAANKPNLDQSQFDVLNIAGLKFFVDEVRIATTFEEAVPSGASEICDNGVDDDGDGGADCDDDDCADTESCQPQGNSFSRGDANTDGNVDISDPTTTLQYLFLGGAELRCVDAADTDDDGMLSLTDAIYVLNHLFLGTTAPPAPYPGCGRDETADGFECETSPANCE